MSRPPQQPPGSGRRPVLPSAGQARPTGQVRTQRRPTGQVRPSPGRPARYGPNPGRPARSNQPRPTGQARTQPRPTGQARPSPGRAGQGRAAGRPAGPASPAGRLWRVPTGSPGPHQHRRPAAARAGGAHPRRAMRLGRTIRRLWTSVVLVGLLLAVVLARLVWLQGMDAGGYALAASDEKREFVTLHAARGSIVDRNGVPLAYTADAKDIVADPTMVRPQDRAELCRLAGAAGRQERRPAAQPADLDLALRAAGHRALAGGRQADRGTDAERQAAARHLQPGHPAAAVPGAEHRLQRGRPGPLRRRRGGRHRVQLRLAAAWHRRLGELPEGLGRQRQSGRPDQAQGGGGRRHRPADRRPGPAVHGAALPRPGGAPVRRPRRPGHRARRTHRPDRWRWRPAARSTRRIRPPSRRPGR